jgi:hypothetical protein
MTTRAFPPHELKPSPSKMAGQPSLGPAPRLEAKDF